MFYSISIIINSNHFNFLMENALFYVLILFSVIGVSLLIAFIDQILKIISEICTSVREFIIENTSLFTIIFLFIFFLEQMILIILIYTLNVSIKAQVLISLFALIVVTTAALQKFIWEYKFQKGRERLVITSNENKRVLLYMKKILESNEDHKIIKRLKK